MDKIDILQRIQEAEMILIGIGEEFDDLNALKKIPEYLRCRQKMLDEQTEKSQVEI